MIKNITESEPKLHEETKQDPITPSANEKMKTKNPVLKNLPVKKVEIDIDRMMHAICIAKLMLFFSLNIQMGLVNAPSSSFEESFFEKIKNFFKFIFDYIVFVTIIDYGNYVITLLKLEGFEYIQYAITIFKDLIACIYGVYIFFALNGIIQKFYFFSFLLSVVIVDYVFLLYSEIYINGVPGTSGEMEEHV